MKKRISLDCDGVVADVGEFFRNSFRNSFGSYPPKKLIEAIYKNNVREYSKRENLEYEELQYFFKKYNQNLFASLPELRLVEGAKEGIENLLENGIEVVVNSYRPSSYCGLRQDTERITREWFNENGICVPINLAENKKSKIDHINFGNFDSHVDDDIHILNKLDSKRTNSVFFNRLYSSKERKYPYFSDWQELIKFLESE